MVVDRVWGQGEGEFASTGNGVSVWEDEQVLGMGGGGGRTAT